MIPVKRVPAPTGFNKRVLRPGLRWLKKKGISLKDPLPAGVQLKPYWRRCLSELHERYGGVCAYLCVYMEAAQRNHTVDHFIAQTKAVEHAYRWSNYRLACLGMNGRKYVHEDVLDPFNIGPETFHINFFDGSIKPNPALSADLKKQAQATIDRLGLDDGDCRKMRRGHYDDYRSRSDQTDFFAYLKRRSPFVAFEIQRQDL